MKDEGSLTLRGYYFWRTQAWLLAWHGAFVHIRCLSSFAEDVAYAIHVEGEGEAECLVEGVGL